MNTDLSAEQQAQAAEALDHQKSGRYAEAAQVYTALLSRIPQLWPACYNLGLVYQHLNRLPEAAEMYSRAVRLNPQLAEGFNNLGNVFKLLKNEKAAIEAYQRALALNAKLPEASYNIGTMLQARGDLEASIAPLRLAVAAPPPQEKAWDALYRGLLGLGRQEEAIQALLDWERAFDEPSPERVVAGLALCRPMGDRECEARYLQLALTWPFAEFTPESFATVLGMLQYFDVTRADLLRCYRRYDTAISARHPIVIAPLPRRAAGSRLRIGYVSADFRRHVMGRMMLEVLSHHDRSLFSILLISTCPPIQHDAITTAFRAQADGFADISELDDFAAARSIAEADIDVLVDLAGHTMAARPAIYAHRPARTIVTHLGYHGSLGLSSVDFKLTDRIADRDDAGTYQIERPYILESCVFPLVRVAASDINPVLDSVNLSGKFVFGAFVNLLKLSPRCLAAWRRVLEAVPESILLFSPLNPAENLAIGRITKNADIDSSRIAILPSNHQDDAALRARYRLVHAVMDTFPYAGGDTTLAALDMGVPVVTLCGERHSERIGTSILGHLGLTELVADTVENFVDLCVRLARDEEFMAQTRNKIAQATTLNAINAQVHVRALERAFSSLAVRKPVLESMTFGARQFFQSLHDAMRRQRIAADDQERRAIAAVFAELRRQQPDYPPLLRAQAELAQVMNDLLLASDCLAAFLKQSPDDIDARLTLAGFLMEQGATADAMSVMDEIPPMAAADIRLLKLRAHAHVQLGQWERARDYSAIAVERAPADVQALFWHGTALSHLGEAEAALVFLNRALILAPHHAEAAYNAGVLLAELGNHADAAKVFRRVLSTSAGQPAHLHLLHALQAMARRDDWHDEAMRFISAYPELERTRFIESRVARHEGNLEREAEILLPLAEQMTATQNDALAVELIAEFLPILPYHDVSPRLLQRLHARYREAAHIIHPPASFGTGAHQPAVTSRIRIGYLTDFSLSFSKELINSLVGHHDHNRFAITIYALSPSGSVPRTSLEVAGARVVVLAAFDERLAADRIRADQLDILVDASGGGTYAKPHLLSSRPASRQISLPGLARTASEGELDWRISDRVLDVENVGELDTVAPLFVEGCAIPVVAWVPLESALTRKTLGIAQGIPVFGVLTSAERISLRCLTLWKAISQRIPDGIFLLCPRDIGDLASIQKMLVNAGITAERMVHLPPSYGRPHDLALTGAIDVILDTVPGNDYFSAMTSLIEGIPLVTMAGRMTEERVALSLLTYLGETSTVAASGRDYVEIASRLAHNSVERNLLVGRLRSAWQRASGEGGTLSMQRITQQYENAFLAAIAGDDVARMAVPVEPRA